MTIDSVTIQNFIDNVEKSLAVAKALAPLVPGHYAEDAIVEAQTFLNLIKPYAAQPWLPEAVNFFTNLLQQADPQAVIGQMKAMLPH